MSSLRTSEFQFCLSFSGHETFPIRYTWPAKGVRGVEADAHLFSREDALVELGVGKNMVASMRFWCDAMRLITADGQIGYTPSLLGSAVFGSGGWDPFLETAGTAWLLHWLLVTRREKASSWFLLFTMFSQEYFSRDQVTKWLMEQVEADPRIRATENSIKRDVDVFLRTYTPSQNERGFSTEESFDSPLVELGLIAEEDSGFFTFVRGAKPALPPEVFSYALLEYWHDEAGDRGTLSFETLLYRPGCPGAAFKLSENALAELLESVAPALGLQFDDTAGMRLLIGNPDTSEQAKLRLLKQYYNQFSNVNNAVI